MKMLTIDELQSQEYFSEKVLRGLHTQLEELDKDTLTPEEQRTRKKLNRLYDRAMETHKKIELALIHFWDKKKV